MCAGCSKRADKSEFIRIVKEKSGKISVDTGEKIFGRSAYLCKDKACLEKLKKSRRLPTLLRCEGEMDPHVWEQLEALIDN